MEQENDDSALPNIRLRMISIFMMNWFRKYSHHPPVHGLSVRFSAKLFSDQDTSVYHVDENNSVESYG